MLEEMIETRAKRQIATMAHTVAGAIAEMKQFPPMTWREVAELLEYTASRPEQFRMHPRYFNDAAKDKLVTLWPRMLREQEDTVSEAITRLIEADKA